MRIVPQEISKSDIISSTVVDEYNIWDSNKTYSPSATLSNDNIALFNEYYYRSVAVTTGDTPLENEGTKWIKWGVSNKYSMFDLRSTTSSSSDNQDIVVEFDRGFINSIVIGNYVAKQVKIEVVDKTTNDVYETIYKDSSVNQYVFDYWDYIYEPYFNDVSRGLYFEINKYESGVNNTKIRVTFVVDPITNTTSCGYLIGGEYLNMGETLDNVKFNFNSFSTKTTDDYGIITITKRSVQDLIDFETKIPREESVLIKNRVKKQYDDISAFVIDENNSGTFDNMITLATISDISTIVTNIDSTIMSWSIHETI